MNRIVRALALTIAVAAIACGRASSQTAAPQPCTTVGDAVALQMDGLIPVVLGSAGTIARFTGLEPKDDRVPRQSPPPQLYCTGVHDAVALAIEASGTLLIADAKHVHVFARASGMELRSFSPVLSADEAIAGIAVLHGGGIELAIVQSAPPAGKATARFDVYAGSTEGDAARALRSFHYNAFRGPISAITTDIPGRTYVYDDAGEYVVFRPAAVGAATPVKIGFGPWERLRPVALGVHGSRQLAMDELGALLAADDGIITVIEYPSQVLPQGAESAYTFARAPRSGMQLVRGLAVGKSRTTYVLSVDPDTSVATLKIYPSRWVPQPYASLVLP